jgi:hypothetical protein
MTMRRVTRVFLAVAIGANALHAVESFESQLSASEGQQPNKPRTHDHNPEAYALYLKGRAYWNKRTLSDLQTAVSYFNQAIAQDSDYALAYAGLADAYAVLPDYGGSPTQSA